MGVKLVIYKNYTEMLGQQDMKYQMTQLPAVLQMPYENALKYCILKYLNKEQDRKMYWIKM